jgi:VIT1/CCC1 family predicted Fe2+/Mn2+ transporter
MEENKAPVRDATIEEIATWVAYNNAFIRGNISKELQEAYDKIPGEEVTGEEVTGEDISIVDKARIRIVNFLNRPW